MDGNDACSITPELRRFGLSKTEPPSPQPPTCGESNLAVDRHSIASLHLNFEQRVSQLPGPSDPIHQPRDHRLRAPAELQSTSSTMQSVLLRQSAWTSSSPEIIRSSNHQSNSTIGYSTGCSTLDPEDFGKQLRTHMSVAHCGPAFLQTSTAPMGLIFSPDKSLSHVNPSNSDSEGSCHATKARHVSGVSSGSSATASGTSSRPHTQRRSQRSGEVDITNHDHTIKDLLPFAKARLDNMTFTTPKPASGENLRRQILDGVFGWKQDVEELIRDELSRHSSDSMHAVLLSKWLGATDAAMVSTFACNTMTSANWMAFALIQMSGQTMTAEVGRTLAKKMLKKGDIHVAASILIGIGEHAHAVDMYTSKHNYLEAILLTCLKFPDDSERQSSLVRRWGEHIMIHSRQLLAIRCLSCANMESTKSWASLNTEMAECLILYMRKVGLDNSAPLQPSPHMSSPCSTSVASSSSHNQPQLVSRARKTTSPAARNITPGAITAQRHRSSTKLAKSSSYTTTKFDASPSFDKASVFEKHEDYTGQTAIPAINETSRQRLSSIWEKSESPKPTLPASNLAPTKPAPHDKKSQRLPASWGTLPIVIGPALHSSRQPIQSFAKKTREDTPHPDSQPPFRTRDEIFEAFIKSSQPRNGFEKCNSRNPTDDSECSSDSGKIEAGAKASPPVPKSDHQQARDWTPSAACRENYESSPATRCRTFSSLGTSKGPLHANETMRTVGQCMDSPQLPSSFPKASLDNNLYKEPVPGQTARERSVERGRSSRRVRTSYRFTSASTSLSPAELICSSRRNTSSKSSKRPYNRKIRARHRGSYVRPGSEPGHRRPPLRPAQEPEQGHVRYEKTGNAHLRSFADHSRRYHDKNICQPEENDTHKPQKDHQHQIEGRTNANDHHATYDTGVFGLGITAADKSGSDELNKGTVLSGVADRSLNPPQRPNSNAARSPPFLQQSRFPDNGPEKLSGFATLSSLPMNHRKKTLDLSPSSDPALSYQESAIPFPETRSVPRTSRNADCSDFSFRINFSNATNEPTPRPSSCPSPDGPILRQFDAPVHRAFLRDIRPSKFRPGPSSPTRRDPSRGGKPPVGEAWELATEDHRLATASAVAVVPVSDQPVSRMDKRASGHHRYHKSFNEGITHKFKAMADRVRSTSGDAKSSSKRPPVDNVATAAIEAPANKSTAPESAKSTGRGRKNVSTNIEGSILHDQHPPYESFPPIRYREALSPISLF